MASEALDLTDIAAILTDLHGRPVERRIITDEQLQGRLAAHGAPPPVIAITLGMYRTMRAGEFATVDPTLAALLGRGPTILREVLTAAG